MKTLIPLAIFGGGFVLAAAASYAVSVITGSTTSGMVASLAVAFGTWWVFKRWRRSISP